MGTLRQELLEIAKENIDGMTRDEAIYWLDNDAIPGAGGVSGLIYYSETQAIACKHHDEINELLDNAGITKHLSLNDMAWAAWELLIFGNGKEIADELDLEE